MGIRSRLKNKIKKALGAPPPAAAAESKTATTTAEAAASTAVPQELPTEPTGDGFHAVVSAAGLPEGGRGTYYAGDVIVVVFRHEGSLYAINNTCTHEDGPIGEGDVNGTVIACPYHDWRFDFTSGKCLEMENRDVATYAIREQDGFVWVGPPVTEGANLHARGGEHNDGMEFADDQGRPADWTGEH